MSEPHTFVLAEFLCSLGWSAPGDAQFENLEANMAEVLRLAAAPSNTGRTMAEMPNLEPTLRGGVEFWINEEWRCAINNPTCSARLSCIRHDPDDYRVRVRVVKDDDALLAEIQQLRAERDALRDLLAVAEGYARHPDYDWDIGFAREVTSALAPRKEKDHD